MNTFSVNQVVTFVNPLPDEIKPDGTPVNMLILEVNDKRAIVKDLGKGVTGQRTVLLSDITPAIIAPAIAKHLDLLYNAMNYYTERIKGAKIAEDRKIWQRDLNNTKDEFITFLNNNL